MTSAEHPDGVRSCRARIEGSPTFKFDKKRDLRIGRVIFFGLLESGAHVTGRIPGRDYLLKAAIAVRAGEPVMLRIPPEARGAIALNYAAEPDGTAPNVQRVGDGQSLVLIRPCSPRTRRFSDRRPIGKWTEFSGGFVFRERDCYPIEVSSSGKDYKRKVVSLGRRCGSGYADGGPR